MNPVIELPNARVTGSLSSDGTQQFLGLRYASASRGKEPRDVSVEGSIDATSYGPICPQVPGFLEQTLGLDASAMDEDCLSLNIYTPSDALPDSQLPVLFWIHGGAYTNGAGSLAWYHGGRLAARGAVVVSINYRLGALGFLGRGNLGVKDMVSALRWTQRNISSFGGDPSRVTIFGESAGGSAVVSLMACAEARPFFHRAWAMSPSIGQLRSAERADEIEAMFLEHAGIANLAEFTTLSLDQILATQSELLTRASDGFDWFAPTADGEFLASPLLSSSSSCKIPFVIGTNRDENKLWAAFDAQAGNRTSEDWQKFIGRTFPANGDHARKVYESHRPNESPHFLMSAVQTDLGFRFRAWDLVDQRIQQSVPTWMYWFTWPTPAFGGILGSCHALDIPFAFDNLDAPGGDLFTGTGVERLDIARRFADEIVQFATHGHPSWAQYNHENRPTLVIDAETELQHDPESEIRLLR